MAAGKTIAAVDDNPDLLHIVRTFLEQNGYRVVCAFSGPELLSQLEQQTPDLILLDIMMPNMDGIEVLTRLKGNPKTSSIPVIMLTVKDQHPDIIEAYKQGCDYYVTKPFTAETLLNSIKTVLG